MIQLPFGTESLLRQASGSSDRSLLSLFKLIDFLVIVGLLALLVTLYRPAWDERYALAALLAATAFLLTGEIAGLYRPLRGESISRGFFQILSLWGTTVLLLLLLAYALKTSAFYSRIAVVGWILVTPLTLSGWRLVARALLGRLVKRGGLQRNALLWGSGELADQVAHTIRRSPWLGLRLVNYLTDQPGDSPSAPTPTTDATALTPIDRLELQARRGDFDILYIALPTSERERILEVIDRLADTTVSIYMVPDYFTTSLFHGTWGHLEGIPVIRVFDTPFWGVDGWLKRAQDLVLASLILTLMAVPMLAIALGVKLSSPGPILFKQRRYGLDGQEIQVWKFRSMRVCEDGPKVPQARRDDPRVTKLGALLRCTSLDELRQFFNVLRGQMSIVGPRPHAVAHNELYRKQIRGYMLRHKVKPGITGWAQINGWRGETDDLAKMQKRVEHDLWYIRNWSLWLDLKIVLLTAVSGFRGQNAY